MSVAEPIKDKKDIKRLGGYFLEKGQVRNYVMIVMGVHTALRINDLLQLQVKDIYDINNKSFYNHITLIEQKTKKRKSIALNKQVIKVLKLYFASLTDFDENTYIFSSNRENKPISRVQAYRIIIDGVKNTNIYGNISCHSLRKTFGYHSWKDENTAPVVLMELFNHSDYNVTRKYLGVSQDDLDMAYLNANLM